MAIHGRTDLAAAQDAARGDVHALSEQLGAGLLTAAEWTAAADGVLAALAASAAAAVLRGGPQAAVARALGLHLALVRAGLAAYSTTVAGMNRAARASVPTALLPPLLPPPPPPPGPPGREGPAGPPGRDARGLRGLAGVPGVAGPPGLPGAPGGAGRDGGPGLPGRRGLPGAPGVSAVRWAGAWQDGWPYAPGDFVGHAGGCWVALRPTRGEPPGVIAGAWDIVAVPGEDGAPGPAGPAGRDGVDGSDGPRGSRGPSGRPGDPGPAGPPGVDGAAGAAFLSGAGAPSLGLGRAGDAYINVETGDLYRRTTTWTQTGNLRGPRGDRGAPGPRGATGRPGPPGTSLIIGTGGGGNGSGAPGPPGPAGPAGPAGAAATVDVGTTTTGAPGTPAAVTNRGTTGAAVFDFVIPEGEPGAGGTGGTSFDDTAPPTTSAVAEAPAAGDDAFAARRDHVHGREAFGTPGTAAFGDSASAGTAATVPHADHRHGMPANPVSYGSPAASAVGDPAADGAATTIPRSDHRHAREAFGAAGASAVTDAGAAGSAGTVAHSDHQHGREGFGAPSTQAFGDSAVTGTAATVPHADHKHAMPANPVSYGSPGASAVADTSSDGVATTLPRSDHRHAREGFGAPSTQAFGDAAATGTALTVPHSDHKHAMPANPVPAFGSPAASAVGDTAADGAATTLPRSDHRHAREGFGTPGTAAFGASPAAGAATTVARSDHAHGMPANPTSFATPTIALGTAAAGGVLGTVIRSDATIAAFDATAPTPSAVADAAATGSAAVAARRDHVHGREAFGAPGASAVGDPTANGTALTPARSDHRHAREAFATPAVGLGIAAAPGSAATLLRSDATLAAFDATVPVTQAFGDTAAVGAAAVAARRDHKHGVPVAAAYNAITNPACNIFQLGNSGAAAADGTTWADAWTWFQSGGGAIQHNAYAVNGMGVGSSNYSGDVLQMLVTTADTSIGAAEYYYLRQLIEGYNVQPLGGSMSLSFYFLAVKAGTYSVSLGTRSGGYFYVMEANVAANTWTYCAFPNIPAPPVWEGDMRKQIGLFLRLVLAGGSNYQTSSLNAWNAAARWVSTNQVNGVDAINNAVYWYGVNLVPGPYAIPYRPQDYQAELERARRYRQRYAAGSSQTYGPSFSDGTTTGMGIIALSTPMISAPAAVFTGASTFWHYQLSNVFTPTGVALVAATPVLVRVSLTGMAGLTNGASGLFMDSGGGTSGITLEAYPT